jgi:hypothetical protein
VNGAYLRLIIAISNLTKFSMYICVCVYRRWRRCSGELLQVRSLGGGGGGGAEARLRAEANTAVVSWVESGGGGETKCPL